MGLAPLSPDAERLIEELTHALEAELRRYDRDPVFQAYSSDTRRLGLLSFIAIAASRLMAAEVGVLTARELMAGLGDRLGIDLVDRAVAEDRARRAAG